jgi:GntR family transcriptional repressor for pyruvate dehydrogenase complex
MLAALHGFSVGEMFEARRVLEVGLAGLAAERRSAEHLAAISEEVTEMYASVDNPQQYLVHDIRFHRAVAAASKNPILVALMEMVTAVLYDLRRETVERARDFDESLALHRRIYRAIRAGDGDEARAAMSEHLLRAEEAYRSEELDQTTRGRTARSRKKKPSKGRKSDGV